MNETSVKELMDECPELWGEFEFSESTKAYEVVEVTAYRNLDGTPTLVHIANEVFAFIGEDSTDVLDKLVKAIEAMRVVAIASKPEGYDVGTGKLFVQERLLIEVEEIIPVEWLIYDKETKTMEKKNPTEFYRPPDCGKFRATWYGKIGKI